MSEITEASRRGDAMSSIKVLMVTCCVEQTRFDILEQVVKNVTSGFSIEDDLLVFDNGSTMPGTTNLLTDHFNNVYRTDKNVGYWSAVDWWLDKLAPDPPRYTYIIESDMMHYGLDNLPRCIDFLDKNPKLGSMRLHEYSIENSRFYNKDAPLPESRTNLWQSHTNKITGESVRFDQVEGPFWKTNFLTQLPALNRYDTMKHVFSILENFEHFSELDFQKLYHACFPEISIIDGGIFNCDLNLFGSKVVTGSWTSPEELKRLGYQATRFASITPKDRYTVRRI